MATIVTRSGKGSPLTNDEVDANFTNLNTDKLETAGGAVTGNITFGDNDKAIFGAGSDLQIYHDGGASYIQDTGTGALYLQGDAGVNIRNAAGTENKAVFASDGAVTLYYDNAAKFATTATGIDVTGTVTVDGNTGEGINIGDVGNSVDRLIRFENSSGTAKAAIGTIQEATFGRKTLAFYTNNVGDDTTDIDLAKPRLAISRGGDISFYEDTGTTPKFFWDASAETLSIGSPSADNVTLYSTDDVPRLEFEQGGTVYASIGHRGASAPARQNIFEISSEQSDPMAFRTNGSEAMRIDSSGLLTNQIGAVFNESGADSDFRVESDNNAHMLFVDAGNNAVGINTSSPGANVGLTVEGQSDNVSISLLGDNPGATQGNRASIRFNADFTQAFEIGMGDNMAGGGRNFTIQETSTGASTTATAPAYVFIGNGDGRFYFTDSNDNIVVDLNSEAGQAFVFNENSTDTDFRVESDNNANMLFVDASADVVNIGSTAGAQGGSLLHVRRNASCIEWGHGNNSAGYFGTLGAYGNNGHPYIGWSTEADTENVNTFATYGAAGSIIKGDLSGNLIFAQVQNANATGQTPVERLKVSPSEFIVNDDSLDYNFRVESDTNSHALVVDAGTSNVGIGTSLAGAPLTVSGDNSSTHALVGYFTHETSANTVDILSVTNQTTNSGTAIYGRLVATSATSNNSAVIEFWASLSRNSGGANTATAVTPVVAKAIAGTSISAGTLAWSGTTLQYTTSSSANYIGYSMELQITNRDGATITILP